MATADSNVFNVSIQAVTGTPTPPNQASTTTMTANDSAVWAITLATNVVTRNGVDMHQDRGVLVSLATLGQAGVIYILSRDHGYARWNGTAWVYP